QGVAAKSGCARQSHALLLTRLQLTWALDRYKHRAHLQIPSMKFVVAVLGAIALVACNGSRRSATPTPLAAAMRLAGCEGPATSLPDSLARTLPPRTGRMIPDDRWADLA